MDTYAADNWACPVQGCGFPLACRGAREGSYLKINPQIQTVVSSLTEIANALNNAPKEWWNIDEEEESDDEEEEVDFQPNYTPKSPRITADAEKDEDSPESDSQKTEAFDMPSNNSKRTNNEQTMMMNAIAETSMDDARSCGLPSQSPNCSPIAVMASQASVPMTQRKETPTVRFQEEATTMEAEVAPTVPRVLVASALSTKDRELLDSFVDASKIELVTSCEDSTDTVDFAVCGNAEMETCDGFLVGRTYGYLLAVARGIPIVNISYFATKQTHDDEMMPPLDNHKHQIIGDVTSSEWMAPQRAIQNKGGKPLLDGYKILLFGDFASLRKSPSKRSRSGVAKKMDEDSQEAYSLDRLECLLESCGATVARDVSSLVGVPDNVKVAVMIRPDPHPRDWRAARKELEDYPTLPLIRGNWLLDSISDYTAKEFDGYTQAKK